MFALSKGTCALIGNCIGSNNVPLAKRFFSLTAKFTMLLTIIIALAMILVRQAFLDIYTDDKVVQEISHGVLLVMAIIFLFDGFQNFLQGPIRALGLQEAASYFTIGNYWLIGVPSAAYLSFV